MHGSGAVQGDPHQCGSVIDRRAALGPREDLAGTHVEGVGPVLVVGEPRRVGGVIQGCIGAGRSAHVLALGDDRVEAHRAAQVQVALAIPGADPVALSPVAGVRVRGRQGIGRGVTDDDDVAVVHVVLVEDAV